MIKVQITPNSSDWPWLKSAIIGAQEFNIFGIPIVGSDVCGFGGNTNEELCLRWQVGEKRRRNAQTESFFFVQTLKFFLQQAGAFHSFYRNHNTLGAKNQDPPSIGAAVVAATRTANLWRYRHLPYLHS